MDASFSNVTFSNAAPLALDEGFSSILIYFAPEGEEFQTKEYRGEITDKEGHGQQNMCLGGTPCPPPPSLSGRDAQLSITLETHVRLLFRWRRLRCSLSFLFTSSAALREMWRTPLSSSSSDVRRRIGFSRHSFNRFAARWATKISHPFVAP